MESKGLLRSLHWRGVAIALMSFLAVGCGDDDEAKGENAAGAENSSGGESTKPLEKPRGSVNPDEGGWDGDEAGSSGGESAAEAPTEKEKKSPWGETRAEQCKAPVVPPIASSAQSKIREGLTASRKGQNALARRAFEAALQNDAKAYSALYNLGVLADREGQSSKAVEYYQRAIRARGDYAAAARGLTVVYARTGRASDAVKVIAPMADRYRTNLDLQAAYAEALASAKRYDDAWDAARRALRCDERHVPALKAIIRASLAQGRSELVESVLEQALSITQSDAELHFINGGVLAEKPGRTRESREAYAKAVELAPDFVEARMALGLQMLSGGNYEEARKHFEIVSKLMPNLVSAQLNLADTYRSLGKWKKATDGFERVLKIDANTAEAHFNLGLLYMTAGDAYPGMDEMQAVQKSIEYFTRYRDVMGPRLRKDDPVPQYLKDLDRRIERIKRRLAREKRNKERAAREAAEGGE